MESERATKTNSPVKRARSDQEFESMPGSLSAEIMGITDQSNSEARTYLTRQVVIPAAPIAELWTPIPYIIPAQLFAAKLAEAKGLNPDLPRALSGFFP